MVGRRQDRPEGLPENGGGDASLLDMVEKLVEGVTGSFDHAFDSIVERIRGLMAVILFIKGVEGKESREDGGCR